MISNVQVVKTKFVGTSNGKEFYRVHGDNISSVDRFRNMKEYFVGDKKICNVKKNFDFNDNLILKGNDTLKKEHYVKGNHIAVDFYDEDEYESVYKHFKEDLFDRIIDRLEEIQITEKNLFPEEFYDF